MADAPAVCRACPAHRSRATRRAAAVDGLGRHPGHGDPADHAEPPPDDTAEAVRGAGRRRPGRGLGPARHGPDRQRRPAAGCSATRRRPAAIAAAIRSILARSPAERAGLRARSAGGRPRHLQLGVPARRPPRAVCRAGRPMTDSSADRPRRRRPAELHEGGPGRRRPPVEGRRAAPRPHRSALRRGAVGGLLPRSRPAPARPRPRCRLRQPGRSDRRPDGGARGRDRRAPAGRGRGLRGHQLDPRRGARDGQARDPARPRRGRPAQLRPVDAGGDQPGRYRPALRPAVRDQPGGARQPRAGRGSRGRRSSSATR